MSMPPEVVRGAGDVEGGVAGEQRLEHRRQEAFERAVALERSITIALVGEPVRAGDAGDDIAVDGEGALAAPVGGGALAGDDQLHGGLAGQLQQVGDDAAGRLGRAQVRASRRLSAGAKAMSASTEPCLPSLRAAWSLVVMASGEPPARSMPLADSSAMPAPASSSPSAISGRSICAMSRATGSAMPPLDLALDAPALGRRASSMRSTATRSARKVARQQRQRRPVDRRRRARRARRPGCLRPRRCRASGCRTRCRRGRSA